MPSPRSIWLISSPLSPSADAGEMLADIQAKLDPSLQELNFGQGSIANNGRAAAKKVTGKELGSVNRVEWGEFKVRRERRAVCARERERGRWEGCANEERGFCVLMEQSTTPLHRLAHSPRY